MEMEHRLLQAVEEDTTILLPCREGDHVLWLRGTGLLGDPTTGVEVRDFWELKAGNTVRITNRFDDLPEWFKPTPMEVRGSAAFALLPRVQAGDVPDVPMEAANIWRVKAGDAIGWTGRSRPGWTGQNGVLAVFDIHAPCLVTGEPNGGSLDDWMYFGAPSSSEHDPDAIEAARYVVSVVRSIGLGRVRIDGWAIG